MTGITGFDTTGLDTTDFADMAFHPSLDTTGLDMAAFDAIGLDTADYTATGLHTTLNGAVPRPTTPPMPDSQPNLAPIAARVSPIRTLQRRVGPPLVMEEPMTPTSLEHREWLRGAMNSITQHLAGLEAKENVVAWGMQEYSMQFIAGMTH
ncbi:hypothetical protein LTR53_002255 [Teratosphaeriaceae sp. CCFEE 6253]|nr:hypothetical protein LTR53_002255 [Teratosphaeriaceae sp. CCFEE 6253]